MNVEPVGSCSSRAQTGLWVVLTFGWQLLVAMYGGHVVIVTVRGMLPTGGLRLAASN